MTSSTAKKGEALELPLTTVDVWKRHPLLLELVEMTQAELLEPEQNEVLKSVWRFFDDTSRVWPPAASPELRLALEALKILNKRYTLDRIFQLLLYRKKQMSKQVDALLMDHF